MPTALTTATAREDLLEITISMSAAVVNGGVGDAMKQRVASIVARYLNTLRLHEETGEAEHDELHHAAQALLDAAVVAGALFLVPKAPQDRRADRHLATLPTLASVYLSVMNRLHNPGRAIVPDPPPAPPPAPPPLPPRQYTQAELRQIADAAPKVYKRPRAY